ncbi:MAG: cellulase family glycosylhydrolase [Solirubrobacterales bacterium]
MFVGLLLPAGAAGSLSIAVVGNRLVNGSGNTVRLLGVNRPSPEYACFYGYAYADGPGNTPNPLNNADAAAIAAWHATAVRIPLNEDCWLGLNGYPPATVDGRPSGLTAAGYRQAIVNYVTALHAHGLYAILDLHWTGPGATPADGQRSLPDDHSAAFWTSVADTFRSDPGVVFDVFNEPFGSGAFPVSWGCWRNGGCQVPTANDQTDPAPGSPTYTAVGIQAMVDAIRATGATQPIMLGGLSYANDLRGWRAHEPSDPLDQLIASFHNYTGQTCDTQSCWDATIAPVAAQAPVVTGEFDEDDCPAPAGGSPGENPANFDNRYMAWADAHGVSYTAWGWFVLDSTTCSSLALISDYAGTPLDPNGVALKQHLTALANTAASAPAPPSVSVAPVVSGVSQSHLVWREGNRLATIARQHGIPVGTTFSFRLNQPATVRFAFRRVRSRRSGRRRVAHVRRSRHRYTRNVTKGTLRLHGHAGTNRVKFQGRVSRRGRLRPGRYTVVITAINAAKQHSAPVSLSFKIASG